MPNPDVLIWWLNKQSIEAMGTPKPGCFIAFESASTVLPDYIQTEMASMEGRSLLGRLWVPDWLSDKTQSIGEHYFQSSPFSRMLGRYYGGLVFDRADLISVKAWRVGYITDFELNEV